MTALARAGGQVVTGVTALARATAWGQVGMEVMARVWVGTERVLWVGCRRCSCVHHWKRRVDSAAGWRGAGFEVAA